LRADPAGEAYPIEAGNLGTVQSPDAACRFVITCGLR
jgi:hypothetical protein